jgi:hypothetical protein
MRLPSYTLGIVLAFVLQAGLLGWIVYDRAELLRNGHEIRLTVVPVDPHDLFRGDYVVLNYAISNVRSDALAGDDAFQFGDPIYVSLAADGTATALGHAAPASGTFLKGTIASVDEQAACDGADKCWRYRVDYNLEKFFGAEAAVGRRRAALRRSAVLGGDQTAAGEAASWKRLAARSDGSIAWPSVAPPTGT